MCQIFVSQDANSRPTMAELRAAEISNPHGIGLAYRQDGLMFVARNISVDDVQTIAAAVNGEMIIHFRKASVGPIADSLTHPFDLNLGGEQSLLFHNGTIADWRSLLLSTVDTQMIPRGPWSDTRALALAVSESGNINLLDLFPSNRFAVMAADSTTLYGDWFTLRQGLQSSQPVSARTAISPLLQSKADDTAFSSPIVGDDDLWYRNWKDDQAEIEELDLLADEIADLDDDDYFAVMDMQEHGMTDSEIRQWVDYFKGSSLAS